MYEVDYSSKQLSLFENLEEGQTGRVHDFSCGKTSPAPSQATKDWTFSPCLKKSEKPHFQYLPMHDGQTRDWWNCQTVTLRDDAVDILIERIRELEEENARHRDEVQKMMRGEDIAPKSVRGRAGSVRCGTRSRS